MQIGIPVEIRGGETRVAATPETVKKYTAKGLHSVLVQTGAGAGASIPDEAFEAAGASIVNTAADLYGQSEIVLKVRGPEAAEARVVRARRRLSASGQRCLRRLRHADHALV